MKKVQLNKKTTKMILIVVVIVAVLGIGVFLLTKNLPKGAGNALPETNASQIAVKDPQLNAILESSDSSEPIDAATTIDTNVVDSTGLS